MAAVSTDTELEPCEIFYVGGKYVQDPSGKGGTCMVGQMCVRRYRPLHRPLDSARPAVIFIHGAAQTGTHFERTPDGRLGLAPLLALDGWDCYVVDQPGVGRSRYHAAHMGELTHYPAEQMQETFTSPRPESWPAAELHTQWPGSGKMGDPIFDAFFASQVGHIKNYAAVERLFRAVARPLLERTGPAYLVTHSQSGPIGWQTADDCPELVCGIVALEPHGPPFEFPDHPPLLARFAAAAGKTTHPFGITSTPMRFEPPLPDSATELPFVMRREGDYSDDARAVARQPFPARKLANLSRIPVVIVTTEASYHTLYDDLTVEFLKDAGVEVEHVQLVDLGIRGNGHLMAIELNNRDIQRFIGDWMAQKTGLVSH